MKPQYRFRFVDDRPETSTAESRDRVASLLRSYRRQPARYIVRKLPLGFLVATRDYSAVAAITRE